MSIDCILAFCVALSSEETASNFFRPFCAHQRNAARSGQVSAAQTDGQWTRRSRAVEKTEARTSLASILGAAARWGGTSTGSRTGRDGTGQPPSTPRNLWRPSRWPKHSALQCERGAVEARWHSSRNSAETRKCIFTAKYSTKPPARVGSSLLLGSLTIPKGRPAASQDTSLEPTTNTSPQNAAASYCTDCTDCPKPCSQRGISAPSNHLQR